MDGDFPSRFLKWYRAIDSFMLFFVISLMLIGLFLSVTASPAIAGRIGAPHWHFLHKHLIFFIISFVCILSFSSFSVRSIKLISIALFILLIFLLFITFIAGESTKGAKRWINIFGISIQPSEFLKPIYAVVTAFILSKFYCSDFRRGIVICILIHVLIALPLLMQPDLGSFFTISIVSVLQFFISGLSIYWILICSFILIASIVMAYFLYGHVANRIDSFLSSDMEANYQVKKSIDAYLSGGIWGRGPGEGVIKLSLPDAHTDFIFAVAAEEIGGAFCIGVVLLFIICAIKAAKRLSALNDLFSLCASTGVAAHMFLQAIFNIGISLNLFPTKGMTLPFISYGGSSSIAFAIGIGIYLSLTKKRCIIDRI